VSKRRAMKAARAFANKHYPSAKVVFLGGSWASETAHSESDLNRMISLCEQVLNSMGGPDRTYTKFTV
jgi:hypothetical protein